MEAAAWLACWSWADRPKVGGAAAAAGARGHRVLFVTASPSENHWL